MFKLMYKRYEQLVDVIPNGQHKDQKSAELAAFQLVQEGTHSQVVIVQDKPVIVYRVEKYGAEGINTRHCDEVLPERKL